MIKGLTEILTAETAPWWWAGIVGLVGAGIGGVAAYLTTKSSDTRKLDAEAERWQQTQEHEREQFYRARLLDEAGKLLAVAEAFRGRLSRATNTKSFDENGDWIDNEENRDLYVRVMSSYLEDMHPLRVQLERMRMLADGDVLDAVKELDTAMLGYVRISKDGSRLARKDAEQRIIKAIRSIEGLVHQRVMA